jgi:hypothetical protein
VHASTEDKSDDTEDSLYGELGSVFNQIPKYNMKTRKLTEMRVYMKLLMIMGLE